MILTLAHLTNITSTTCLRPLISDSASRPLSFRSFSTPLTPLVPHVALISAELLSLRVSIHYSIPLSLFANCVFVLDLDYSQNLIPVSPGGSRMLPLLQTHLWKEVGFIGEASRSFSCCPKYPHMQSTSGRIFKTRSKRESG